MFREYRVTVEDEYFDPQIIVVEEGDRVWWDWTKNEVVWDEFGPSHGKKTKSLAVTFGNPHHP